MLHSMRSSMRWARIMRIFYYLLIIAGMVGAYVYVQPILMSMLDSYKNIASELSQAGEAGRNISEGFGGFGSILDQFRDILGGGQ